MTWRADGRRASALGLAGCAAIATLGVEVVASGSVDTVDDTAHGAAAVLDWVTRPLHAVSVPIVACLILVCLLHHVAAALAARAAAGAPMPAAELVAVQFAASAANRVTPAGLGGTSLLGRYLVRRGGLAPVQATAAVSALAVLGALADVVAFAALLAIGAVLGSSSMTREAPVLTARLAGLVSLPGGWTRWALLAVSVVAVVGAFAARRRFSTAWRRGCAAVRGFAGQLSELGRRPARLGALLSASAATTLLLAAGFATASVLILHGLPVRDFGALMIGYMIAAAAGNALPTPGGIGTADAAFVGVLAAASMPAATALAVVVAFRAITFWAPAAIGAGTLPLLRHRGAL